MYCPKCGEQNPDEAKFCGKCGTTISIAAAPQPASSAFGATSDKAAVDPMLKNGMLVASIVIPIVGIIAGIIFLLDKNPEKKAAGKLWLIVGVIAAVVWAILFG